MIEELIEHILDLKRNFLSNLSTTEDASLKQFITGQLNGLDKVEDFLLQKNAEYEFQQNRRVFTL